MRRLTAFLRLLDRFVLRALWQHKGRSAIAIIGIALGVSVTVAIRLANVGVVESFRTAVVSISGDADLQIVGAAGRFDEMLLSDSAWLHRYGAASPITEAYAMFADPQGPTRGTQGELLRGELLHVLGVDVLRDSPLRGYQILRLSAEDREPTPQQLFDLLRDEQAIVITERFAKRKGLKVGDSIPLSFGSRVDLFRIRGLLLHTGPARTLDGNFALMDIAAAQVAMQRVGQLDRVEIKLAADSELDAAQKEIESALSPGLRVEQPNARYGRTETMIEAFQFNLTALSSVALLVGMFLIYNTISISVASRRKEIATLRAVGAGRGTVLMLFLAEAVLLGTAGTMIGLPVGQLLARGAVKATAQTVETFYIAAAAESAAGSPGLGLVDILTVLAVVLPLATGAAFAPAWQASGTDPVELLRPVQQAHRIRSPRWAWLVIGVVLVVLAILQTRLPPVAGIPLFGFASEFCFMLSIAAFAPAVIWLACKTVRGWSRGTPIGGRLDWRLAASNLLHSVDKLSISVAALAVSLGMMFSIAIMVGSFRDTVVYWLETTLTADLSVKPVMNTSAVSEIPMDPAVVKLINEHPAVEATTWFTSRQIADGQRNIRLAATDFRTTLRHGRLLFKQPTDATADLLRQVEANRPLALISESYSLHFDKHPGDQIKLPSADGTWELPVAAVYYDYASNQGTVMIDASWYQQRILGSDQPVIPDVLALYLRDGYDAREVGRQLQQQSGPRQMLYFVTNNEIRREAMRIFDSTFTITYALELIAILVAGLGVASTLITLVYQRQTEIAVLDLLGATRRTVRRIIVLEAILIALIAQILGLIIGAVLAAVLIYVINVQSFGWTIQFQFPWMLLSGATLVTVLVAAVFGLYPARLAIRSDSLQAIREE